MRFHPGILGGLLAGTLSLLTAHVARADALEEFLHPTGADVRQALDNPCTTTDVVCKGCCQAKDSCGWPVDPCGKRYGRFEVTLEGALAWLGSPKGAFAEDTGTPSQIRWDGLDYGEAVGGRAALQYATSTFDRLQVRGAWAGSYDDSGTRQGVYGFSPPATVSALANATLSSDADCWTAEASWIRELTCGGILRIDGILGGRVISFQETATANFAAVVAAPGQPGGTVTCNADNFFYGGQLGAGFHLDASPRLEFTFLVKGLFGAISRDVRVDDSGVFTAGAKSNSGKDSSFSYGAEGEFGIRWRLSSRLALTAGYNVLFLDNTTRANQGMDFAQAGTGAVQPRQPSDDLLVQSVFLGLNVNL